jgi:hypothetical protein
MRSVTRGFMARVLVIISSISSKTRSVVLSICLDRDTCIHFVVCSLVSLKK